MRPASFMASISAGDFLMIMRLAPSLCLPVVSPNSIAFAIAVQTRKTKASRNGAGGGGQHAGGRRAWKPRMQGWARKAARQRRAWTAGSVSRKRGMRLCERGTGGARAGRRAQGASRAQGAGREQGAGRRARAGRRAQGASRAQGARRLGPARPQERGVSALRARKKKACRSRPYSRKRLGLPGRGPPASPSATSGPFFRKCSQKRHTSLMAAS